MFNEGNFKFVGPKPELDLDREKARVALQEAYAKGREKVEGEIEKTAFYEEALRTTNQIISLIFRSFEIDKEIRIDSEQVHFLHQKEFVEYGDSSGTGVYHSTSGAIFINVDQTRNNRAHLISTLLHESLHAVSEQYFYLVVTEEEIQIYDARVGLRISSQWKDHRTNLRGLNEFLVNSLVYYFLREVAQTLDNRFGITADDLSGAIYGSGSEHGDFFESILEIMEKAGKNPNNIIGDIVRSHFSGSLKSLASIDEVFGVGSIRVLGCLDALESEDNERIKVNMLVEEYFLQADEIRKQDIIGEIDEILLNEVN